MSVEHIPDVSVITDDLTDDAVERKLRALFMAFTDGIEDIPEDTRRDLLADIVSLLDRLDSDDAFGTEGWRHYFRLGE